MAAGLHGSARTTPRVRAELQALKEATRALAAQYGLNPKTLAKWRKRSTTADQPILPVSGAMPLTASAASMASSRLTKPYHPWTNGQAERMNRTIKDATVKIFHYEALESLSAHLLAFMTAYNFAKHLKALRWRTPFQAICEAWAKDPAPFKINPHHLIPGPHT